MSDRQTVRQQLVGAPPLACSFKKKPAGNGGRGRASCAHLRLNEGAQYETGSYSLIGSENIASSAFSAREFAPHFGYLPARLSVSMLSALPLRSC